jgi:membrane-associated phospholipid phosphatase
MVHRSAIRIARDYNRALSPPVRWAHIAWAAVVRPILDIIAWAFHPARSHWAAPALVALVLIPIVLPRDRAISHFLSHDIGRALGGDIRREIEAWQQFGGIVSIVVVAVLIATLDPRNIRKLADLAAATISTALVVTFFKILFGRPRPKYDDPDAFSWLFGSYPVLRNGEPTLMHSLSAGLRSELWSMPSSHTSAGAALAVCISTFYPVLRPLCLVLIVIVMIGRTTVGDPPAHWPSDVIAGGCLGWLISATVVKHRWGTMLVNRWSNRGKVRAS